MRGKILFSLLAGLTGCTSLEFIPSPQYPALRRDDVEEFHLFSRRPDRTVESMGRLIYRDLYGGIDSQEFRAVVEREGRLRGAGCGYVARRSFQKQVHFRTNAMDNTNRHGGTAGEIEGNVETVEIVLFQCHD